MRTVSPASVVLAVAALSTVLSAAPAVAGPGDPPAVSPSGPQSVRVGPGSVAPKPVPVEIRNDGDLATDVVVTFDAGDVPEAFDVDMPGADQGCAAVGDVVRCVLAELAFGETHTYTFGVAAAAGAPAAAEGAMRVSSTAGNAPQEYSTTIGLALVAAGIDLALAPVVPTPPGYWSVDPGKSVDVPVTVRNDGGVTAMGVVLQIDTHADDASNDMIQLVAPYDNCTVDAESHHLSCAFDIAAGPGETFAIDPATPIRARINSVAPGNNSYSATVAVRAADLSFAKSTGHVARLVPLRAAMAADLNDYDNDQVLTIAVEGLRAAESVAVGATVTGDIGGSGTLAVGFRNNGPAAVAAREGNGGGARVRLPAGLEVTRACDGCMLVSGLEYTCPTSGFILPGTTEWCRFDVTIVGRPGAPGSIRINAGQQDHHPADDVAPILLVVPGEGAGGGEGLPITGAPAGPAAGVGTLLIGLGLAALIFTRRRRSTNQAPRTY